MTSEGYGLESVNERREWEFLERPIYALQEA